MASTIGGIALLIVAFGMMLLGVWFDETDGPGARFAWTVVASVATAISGRLIGWW